MTSLPQMLFTMLLFSEICGTSIAMPMSVAGNYDDSRTYQESLNALVEDNIGSKVTAGPGPGRVLNLGGLALDNRLDEGPPGIIIVSDTGFRGHRTRNLDQAFSRSLPVLTNPDTDHTPGDRRVKVDRREADLDMLRCMIGRVYRPCWQA